MLGDLNVGFHSMAMCKACKPVIWSLPNGSDWKKWTAFTSWDKVDEEAIEEASSLPYDNMEVLGLLLEERPNSSSSSRLPQANRVASGRRAACGKQVVQEGQADRAGQAGSDEELSLPDADSNCALRYSTLGLYQIKCHKFMYSSLKQYFFLSVQSFIYSLTCNSLNHY